MQELRVIEAFSGIGSQAKALKNIGINFRIVATVEWEIGAMYAYDIIHNGPQNLSVYDNLSKEDVLNRLKGENLSSDGKTALKFSTLRRMSEFKLKTILHSIEKTNNKIDISNVHADDLPDADILTYSFPCQDLSISSYWHKNFSGIDRDAQNRSGLLWEIERILHEYRDTKKKLPKFLVMENVTAISGPLHLDNFESWQLELEKLGYHNFPMNLNAKNFGIPQNRVRTYMISILVNENRDEIDLYMNNTTSLKRLADGIPDMRDFLRLDYTNSIYLKEALESTPNDTESRRKIHADSIVLARGSEVTGQLAKTITTKQDRNPNAGIIEHHLELNNGKSLYRNLTPRETFLLMGFFESDFDLLIVHNPLISKNRKLLSHSKLLKLAGNSIVVNVLEEIFSEINLINNIFFENNNIELFKRNLKIV